MCDLFEVLGFTLSQAATPHATYAPLPLNIARPTDMVLAQANGIVHRDLKLENFIFTTNKTDAEIKLIDFGEKRAWHARTHTHTHIHTHTPHTHTHTNANNAHHRRGVPVGRAEGWPSHSREHHCTTTTTTTATTAATVE